MNNRPSELTLEVVDHSLEDDRDLQQVCEDNDFTEGSIIIRSHRGFSTLEAALLSDGFAISEPLDHEEREIAGTDSNSLTTLVKGGENYEEFAKSFNDFMVEAGVSDFDNVYGSTGNPPVYTTMAVDIDGLQSRYRFNDAQLGRNPFEVGDDKKAPEEVYQARNAILHTGREPVERILERHPDEVNENMTVKPVYPEESDADF